MTGPQFQRGTSSIRNTDIATTGDGPRARLTTSSWSPFRFKAARNQRTEVVAPPLIEKCKDFCLKVESGRYLDARQNVRCEVKSISQTLSVGLLEHIYTVILDASAAEAFSDGVQDTTCGIPPDVYSILQRITSLQTKLDGTDDEDEQRALEEDVTGQILWVSWWGILLEVKQRLAEVLNYIRSGGNSMAPEVRNHFRQGLDGIGEIIKKTPHVHVDDDLAHLQRTMLDARAGISKHQLWLAARDAERDKWSSIRASRDDHPTHLIKHHIHCSANPGH
ncbi:hypothetical protein EDD17DRAFT_682996 [Pisolithus thermaeus]|nr:hypothetical protein EDD17DRAFT_682996 [Pisolithus thermaeus]